MRVFTNILITIGLFILAMVVGAVFNAVNPPHPGDLNAITVSVWLLVFASAIWASISSSNLEFRKYKTGLSYHPVTIFIVHLLLWIVAFPWFLTVRDNITDGSAELKDEFRQQAHALQPHRTLMPPPMPSMVPRPAGNSSFPPPLPPPLSHPEIARGDFGNPGLPPPLPTPPPIPGQGPQSPPDRLEQLQKLADLKAQGVLTEEEFLAEKRKVLG